MDIIKGLANKANKAQGAWIEPTLGNSWVDVDASTYGKVAYIKDQLGFVHLRGIVSTGTSTIFTFPVGYRPLKAIKFAIASAGTAPVQNIAIAATGEVTVTGTGLAFWWLTGISFMAEA